MDPSAVNTEKGVSEITEEQDGPSLESSSYQCWPRLRRNTTPTRNTHL